jgi:secreted trypsin-like serine protease
MACRGETPKDAGRVAFLRRLPTIWNGKPTGPQRYNQCVAVGGERYACTGTMIGVNVVLTAAHCQEEVGGQITRVFLGDDLNNQAAGREVRVAAVHPAPGYNPKTFKNDLAILILNTSRVNTDRSSPAIQPTVRDNERVKIVGFGNVNRRDTFGFGIRREGTIHVRACPPGEATTLGCFPETDLLGLPTDTADACGGDSGGPVFDAQGRVAAVISRPTRVPHDERCGYGSVYTRTDPFKDFIYSIPGATWR